ncbi:flagellar assembly protein FliH [Oceanobacillus chungangensis]|uniref:flagellar assembly protein FliH n=1 Tax=Oceanobacillus chungangensis TaxID=1229152 RepID=UPI0014760C9C|nr:flagellar assembly protein FliH [Oceanobacillus chungangensis]
MSKFGQSLDSNRRIIEIKPIELRRDEQQNRQLIKEEDVATIHTEVQKANAELAELNDKKESLLEATKVEIENEKSAWKLERLKWIESAKEEGYSAGFELGKSEIRIEYQEILNKANAIVETTTKDYHATLEKSEEMIAQLAVKVAEKIIKSTITGNPDTFLELVKAAIKEIEDRSTISIFLHPMNYETVFEQKQELVNLLENESKLSLYVREDLSENACIIEHPFGRVDAGIDTQLNEIRNVLLELSGGE